MKLLVVTPNPTIDRTLHVPLMTVGEVHRTTDVHQAAGGKGLNVTRAARILGHEVLVTGPLAGRAGQIVADLAIVEGLPADWYWLSEGETRTCLLINHDDGGATVINEQGPVVSVADWTGFAAHVRRLAQQAGAVAFSGSVPLGVESGALGVLARSLVTPDRPVYVDTSAAALSEILTQPEGLCVKVNQSELAIGLGLELEDQSIDRLVEAGQMLLDRGAVLVVVTLGSEGALAIAREEAWWAKAPQVEVVSTVGSGDSLLAGLIVARLQGKSLEAALAYGVVCGSANVMTNLPARFELSEFEALLRRVQRINFESIR